MLRLAHRKCNSGPVRDKASVILHQAGSANGTNSVKQQVRETRHPPSCRPAAATDRPPPHLSGFWLFQLDEDGLVLGVCREGGGETGYCMVQTPIEAAWRYAGRCHRQMLNQPNCALPDLYGWLAYSTYDAQSQLRACQGGGV